LLADPSICNLAQAASRGQWKTLETGHRSGSSGQPSRVNKIFSNAECAGIAENFSANSVISALKRFFNNAAAKGTASLTA
jgi:hypothetical protein